MASTAGLTLGDPPIKLIPSYKEEDLPYVDLTHSFNVQGGGTEKRKARLLKLTESVGTADFPELLCRLMIEFEDAAGHERLRLTSGPLLYAKFRECLGPTLKTIFDGIRNGQPQTIAGFHAALREFIRRYIPATAAMDQVQYLRTTQKPYSMSVMDLGLRLRLINQYSAWFTGQNGQVLFPEAHNDRALKETLFPMMKMSWRISFFRTGREVTDDTLSFDDLVRTMQLQQATHNHQFGGRGNGGRGRFGGRQSYHSRHRYYDHNYRLNYGERPNNFRRTDNGGRAPNYGGRGYYGGRQAYGGRGNYGGRGGSFGGRGNGGYNGGRGFQGRGQLQGRGYQGNGGNNGYQGRGNGNGYQQGRGNYHNNGGGYNNGGRGSYNGQQQHQGNGGGQFHHDGHYHEPLEQEEQQEQYQQQDQYYEQGQYQEQQQQQQQEQEPQDQHWIDNLGEEDGYYFEQGGY